MSQIEIVMRLRGEMSLLMIGKEDITMLIISFTTMMVQRQIQKLVKLLIKAHFWRNTRYTHPQNMKVLTSPIKIMRMFKSGKEDTTKLIISSITMMGLCKIHKLEWLLIQPRLFWRQNRSTDTIKNSEVLMLLIVTWNQAKPNKHLRLASMNLMGWSTMQMELGLILLKEQLSVI